LPAPPIVGFEVDGAGDRLADQPGGLVPVEDAAGEQHTALGR
jgi:hypothetical protein